MNKEYKIYDLKCQYENFVGSNPIAVVSDLSLEELLGTYSFRYYHSFKSLKSRNSMVTSTTWTSARKSPSSRSKPTSLQD